MGKQQPQPATSATTPTGGTPSKPLNFANYFLNTGDVLENESRLPDLHFAARLEGRQVVMPEADKIKARLRQQWGAEYTDGKADAVLEQMGRAYERYENGRFNSFRTSFSGMPDTTYNNRRGFVTHKPSVDTTGDDPTAAAAGLKARDGAIGYFGQSPEQMLAENFRRSKNEETQSAQQGAFERVSDEAQVAKRVAKERGYVLIGQKDDKTGQHKPAVDKDGRELHLEGPVDPTRYGYTAVMGPDGIPVLMAVPKHDLATYRGSDLLNVADILPSAEESTIARAVFGYANAGRDVSGLNSLKQMGEKPGIFSELAQATNELLRGSQEVNEDLIRSNAEYQLDSGTGFKRAAYNYLGYIDNSTRNIKALGNRWLGRTEEEEKELLRMHVQGANPNVDMQAGAFSNLPSFMNSVAQLNAQLTTQTALNVLPGGQLGLIYTALDATASSKYDGMRNGLSERESDAYGLFMGGLTFGIAKTLTGQAASKLGVLLRGGAAKEVQAVIRQETAGLAASIAKRAEAKGMELTAHEINAAVNEAKPLLVKAIGGRISALYDNFGTTKLGAFALGAAEEGLDEMADTGFEQATNAGVRALLDPDSPERPEWFKESLTNGTNTFAYKSVGDIIDSALEAGALGVIGGATTSGPMAAGLAHENRRRLEGLQQFKELGATEAFAKYLVQQDFSPNAVKSVVAELDKWKAQGKLGRRLTPDGRTTANEEETENAIMYKSLRNKVESLADLAQQTNLLKLSRGEGQGALAQQLSSALGRGEEYLRTQEGMVQLLTLTQLKKDTAKAGDEAEQAIARALNQTSESDAGVPGNNNGQVIAPAAPDVNGDGQVSQPLVEGQGLNGVPAEPAEEEKAKPKKKTKPGEVTAPDATTKTPVVLNGQERLESLVKLLGDGGKPVLKWSENQREQLNLQQKILTTDGENVEELAALRGKLNKLQQQSQDLEQEMAELSGQEPAVGALRRLAELQRDTERATVQQKQLFDGTLLSYQVQEGLMRLQENQYDALKKGQNPIQIARIDSAMRALRALAFNTETGRYDAAQVRQSLRDNQEYVARRRFSPLTNAEVSQVQLAQQGGLAVDGALAALQGMDPDVIEQALTALEQSAPAAADISVLDAAQQPQAEALMGRYNKLDRRGESDSQSTLNDPAQGENGKIQAPATPAGRPASAPAEAAAPSSGENSATPAAGPLPDTDVPQSAAPAAPTLQEQVDTQAQVLTEGEQAVAKTAGLSTDAFAALQAEIEQTTPSMFEYLASAFPARQVDPTPAILGTPEAVALAGEHAPVVEAEQQAAAAQRQANQQQRQKTKGQRNKSKGIQPTKSPRARSRRVQAAKAVLNKLTAWRAAEYAARQGLQTLMLAEKQVRQAWSADAETALGRSAATLAGLVALMRDMREAAADYATMAALLGPRELNRLFERLQHAGRRISTAGAHFATQLRALAQAMNKRVADIKAVGAAAADMAKLRASEGVRYLLNQARLIHFETQLRYLRPISKAIHSRLDGIRGLLGRTGTSLAEQDAAAPAPAQVPAADGITAAVGGDTVLRVQQLRQALLAYQQRESERLISEEETAIAAMRTAVANNDEPAMHAGLLAFGRDDAGLAGEDLVGAVAEAVSEFDDEDLGLESTASIALRNRISLLIKRLKDPIDLSGLQGTDPEELNEIDYLTGLVGVPGLLEAEIDKYEQQAAGDETSQQNFAAIQPLVLQRLRQQALRNKGIVLYRLRIVPLLNEPGNLGRKAAQGMGIKLLPEAVAAEVLAQNEEFLARIDDLIAQHQAFSINRYRDDDEHQTRILAHRYDVLSDLVDMPALEAAELQPQRQAIRQALAALLQATQEGTASMSHLHAAEVPLRAMLKENPKLGRALLQNMLDPLVAQGMPLRDAIGKLAAVYDDTETPALTVLQELLGPSRAEITTARLNALIDERGIGEKAGTPKNTSLHQLSLEQEYVLQSVMGFLGSDELPLAQLVADTKALQPVQAETGFDIPAATHTMAITGKPGTGKTHLVNALLSSARVLLGYTQANPLRVLASAPNESQRTRLQQGFDGVKGVESAMLSPAAIVDALLSGKPLAQQIIIIDEASALPLGLAGKLLVAVDAYNSNRQGRDKVKLLLLGDPLQLPGVDEESSNRSNAGHVFISQRIGMLRTRPLQQIYRSGYVVLHEGLKQFAKRIVSGIDAHTAAARDLSPVEGMRYSQVGGVSTLEGWKYDPAEKQRAEIVALAQALANSNPEGRKLRVLVSPGYEQREIEALVAAGLTEAEAAGIVFTAADPRDRTVLNYDDAQGGEFAYTFVSVQGESDPTNTLRALYVGASRGMRYVSVRQQPGEVDYKNQSETGELPKYQPASAEMTEARNSIVNDQLRATADAYATATAPNEDTAEPNTENAAQTEDTSTDSEEKAEGADQSDADDADEAALQQVASGAEPTGTALPSKVTATSAGDAEPVDSEAAAGARAAHGEVLARVAGLLAPEVEFDNQEDVTPANQRYLDNSRDPLSTVFSDRLQALSGAEAELSALLADDEMVEAIGKGAEDVTRDFLSDVSDKLKQLTNERFAALGQARPLPAYQAGNLPVLPELGDKSGKVGIQIYEAEQNGQRVITGATFTSPVIDEATGKVVDIYTEELTAAEVLQLNAQDTMAVMREIRERVQMHEQLMEDIFFRLGHQVATRAALRGRAIVHTYALPLLGEALEPTAVQHQAKNGFIARLFSLFTVAPDPQQYKEETLSRDDLAGLSAENGEPLTGNGEFRLRHAADFRHNYLPREGEPAERQLVAQRNRFVVEYVDGPRVLTIGTIRYDGVPENGRIRSEDAARPDNDLDTLLTRIADGHYGPQGAPLGATVKLEGWRNGRMTNTNRFSNRYEDSVSLGNKRAELAAQGKSMSNPVTITTPSTKRVMLSRYFSLSHGSSKFKTKGISGRQVVFITHGNKTADAIAADVQTLLPRLIEQVTKGRKQFLHELNDRQLSAVMKALLEQHDYQMDVLGSRNLKLADYTRGLLTTRNEADGTETSYEGHLANPAKLAELMSTGVDGGQVVNLPKTGNELLPYNLGRNALLGSLFTAEQARATGAHRRGRSTSKDPYQIDEHIPGLLNTVRHMLTASGVLEERGDVNGGHYVVSEKAKALLTPAQVNHLQALAEYHRSFWLADPNAARLSSAKMQDLLLYLSYFDKKPGFGVAEAWDEWTENPENDSQIQYNGYVPATVRRDGKSPLFATTVFPPGFSADDVLTSAHKASVEPSFQLNLSERATELVRNQRPATTQATPPTTTSSQPDGEQQRQQQLQQLAAATPAPLLTDEQEEEMAFDAGDEAAPAGAATQTAAPGGASSDFNDTFEDLVPFDGDLLLAGVVSNPDPQLAADVWRDVDWILGSAFPRAERDTILDRNGVPADYRRILGRVFRGIVELNRLPGGMLSRVAGRHEPLHAVLDLLPVEKRYAILSAALQAMRAARLPGVDSLLPGDTRVEEWLADQFVLNWDLWAQQGEQYRNHPLVKRMRKLGALGEALLTFWQGLRDVFTRSQERPTVLERLYRDAHRGHYMQSRRQLAKRRQSAAPARYASRATVSRRQAYDALSRKIGPLMLAEISTKLGNILYGRYLYDYKPGQPPMSVAEGLARLKANAGRALEALYPHITAEQVELAGADVGKSEFINHPEGARARALMQLLSRDADQSIAPGLKWLDVLLRQRYAFVDINEADAYADLNDDTDDQDTKDVQVVNRDSHLVDKDREALESQRLLRQLETVPLLLFRNNQWQRHSGLRTVPSVTAVRDVLGRAVLMAKRRSTGPTATRADVARALYEMAGPHSEFGIAAASVLARFFDVPNAQGQKYLTVHNLKGEVELLAPSFAELTQRGDAEPAWADMADSILGEMFSFFNTVEPRQVNDVAYDDIANGTGEGLASPLNDQATAQKNKVKSRLFTENFKRQGDGFIANVEVLRKLQRAGITLEQSVSATGDAVLRVRHASMPADLPVFTISVGKETGEKRLQHQGEFADTAALSDAERADYWKAAAPVVEKVLKSVGLGGALDAKLLRNVMQEYDLDGEYTDPAGVRSDLGRLLAKVTGQVLTAHSHAGHNTELAALLHEGTEVGTVKTLMLTKDLLSGIQDVNEFLSRKQSLGKAQAVLSPTIYWQPLLDVQKGISQIAPQREIRQVYNERNQKKSTHRNGTGQQPRLRAVEKVAALAERSALPMNLSHLGYLRSFATGFANLFASGHLVFEGVHEMNVLGSRESGKTKSLVKASGREMHESMFWGGFLGTLIKTGGENVGLFNMPRSDKPSQDIYEVGLGAQPRMVDGNHHRPLNSVVSWVSQDEAGKLGANDTARRMVAQMQQSIRNIVAVDSYERYREALKTLEARPLMPWVTKKERNDQRTPEGQQIVQQQREQAKLLRQKLHVLQATAATALLSGNDTAQRGELQRLADGYSEVAGWLKAQHRGGYWLQALNLKEGVDYDKKTGTYPARVLDQAVMPQAQFLRNEVESLLREADALSEAVGFIPGAVATKAYAAIQGDPTKEGEKDAEEALEQFLGSRGKAYVIRKRVGEGDAATYRYNPLALSYLLTYRTLTDQIETVLNGHHLYFKNHQDNSKRAIARKTPIEQMDNSVAKGHQGIMSMVVFQDTRLDQMHDQATLEGRYEVRQQTLTAEGQRVSLEQPLAVADQTARAQTPMILGLLALEESLGAEAVNATPEQIREAGMKVLAGTEAQDGLSGMNMLQYRMQQRTRGQGYGPADRALQKNVYTGMISGASTLVKTASFMFSNEMLALGNEYLYTQFINSMGGSNSLPMRAFKQARKTLFEQAKAEGGGAAAIHARFDGYLQQEHDWDLTESLLWAWEKLPENAGWRTSIHLATFGSSTKSGANAKAHPLDTEAHFQATRIQTEESGPIMNMFSDPGSSTVARITQEEHIPALLADNFKTSAQVYQFLETLASQGLFDLNKALEKSAAEAKRLGKNDAQGGRAYLYDQLAQLMQQLDQKGTTLAAIEQNVDPNVTLLQQHLQTAIAGAINSAVSKLRFPGVRASVISATGLVNMYNLVYRDEVTGQEIKRKRITRQDLLRMQTKRGQRLVGQTPSGLMELSPMFSQRPDVLADEQTGVAGQSYQAARYGLEVDELRFLHITDAAGTAVSPEQTIAIFRALRGSESLDPAVAGPALQQLDAWGLGTDTPAFSIQPAEMLLPRSVLAPFFTGEELQRFTAHDVANLEPGYFARRELNYLLGEQVSKADKKLRSDLFKQVGREGYPAALRQWAAARGQQVHENLQRTLSPKGTRIPVTNLNSMQLYRFAGWFDSHANSVLVPSEVLTISGADNDGDQITLEYFDAGKRGLGDLSAMLPTELPTAADTEAIFGGTADTGTTAEVVDDNGLDDSVAQQLEQERGDVDPAALQALTEAEEVAAGETLPEEAEPDAQDPDAVDVLPRQLAQTMESIRRSLYKAKTRILTDVRNMTDLFAPIDVNEFGSHQVEAQRQQAVFASQNHRGSTSEAKGSSLGNYEMVANVKLHLNSQGGKTGVGPFVKGRELADVARLMKALKPDISFAVPYAFFGRITTTIDAHWRQIARQLERLANAALDNAKLGYLGDFNINEHTWGSYSAGTMGGMNFAELIGTVNHQYMRMIVADVYDDNHVSKSYHMSLVQKLQDLLITPPYQKQSTVSYTGEGDDVQVKQKQAKQWYTGLADPKKPEGLFQLVQQRQKGQVDDVAARVAAGMDRDEAWLRVYGFTEQNLLRGELTRYTVAAGSEGAADILTPGITEPLQMYGALPGSQEEKLRRYVIEQNFMLAMRGAEMRKQISLLTVLAGVPTNDFESANQARNVAEALGLSPDREDLATVLAGVGDNNLKVLPKQAKPSLTFSTRDIVASHGYLRAAIRGVARDMDLRQRLLLRRLPQLGTMLRRALASGFGYAPKTSDIYNWSRAQVERLADAAFLQARPLTISPELIARYPLVAAPLELINATATSQHTAAGQEQVRRAIANVLEILSQNPEADEALARVGRSPLIALLEFSADGRRIQPELRQGVQLTPDEKAMLEATAHNLPAFTASDPEAGALLQQLLLYYQLVGGGLKLGRGQLTELLPGSVLTELSQHREELVKQWRTVLVDAAAVEARQYKDDLMLRRNKGELTVNEAQEEFDRKPEEERSMTIGESKRQKFIADRLRAHNDPAVKLLGGLLDQFALPLARPDLLPRGRWNMYSDKYFDEEGRPEIVRNRKYQYAKSASDLPALLNDKAVRRNLGGRYNNDQQALPRYFLMPTSTVAGNHIYGSVTDRKGVQQPVFARMYATIGPDMNAWGDTAGKFDTGHYSFMPVLDFDEVTDGTVEPDKSPKWDDYVAQVDLVAEKIAEGLKPIYEARNETPETAEDIKQRLPIYAYGHRSLLPEKVRACAGA